MFNSDVVALHALPLLCDGQGCVSQSSAIVGASFDALCINAVTSALSARFFYDSCGPSASATAGMNQIWWACAKLGPTFFAALQLPAVSRGSLSKLARFREGLRVQRGPNITGEPFFFN